MSTQALRTTRNPSKYDLVFFLANDLSNLYAAMGTHHLEYGFPFTHSTNCVSIALFFFSHLHRLASTPATSLSGVTITSTANNFTVPSLNGTLTTITDIQLLSLISPPFYTFLSILLGIFIFSIVFGRLYTAMHSQTGKTIGYWQSSYAFTPLN
jgi:hypothetical protein